MEARDTNAVPLDRLLVVSATRRVFNDQEHALIRRGRYSEAVTAWDLRQPRHHERAEGDEIACSCGKRWPHDEVHP